MPDTTGAGANGVTTMIESIVDGGVDLGLATTAISYDDDGVDVTGKVEATESVAFTDLTVSPGTGFADETELTLDVDVDFGEPSIGVVVEVVITSQTDSDDWILANEINDPELTGENYSLSSGTVLYSFGPDQ